MENVVWGEVPAQRTRKQEKFAHPVVTMSAIDKPGAGRKFTFNKAAQTALNIQGEDRISFGFETNGKKIFIRKAEGDAGFQLTKTCTLSDKRTYEFIAKRWDLNSEVENNIAIAMNDSYGELQLMTSTEPAVINTVKTVEEKSIPAEIASLDTEADHDVNDIAAYVPMDENSESDVEFSLDVTPEIDSDNVIDEDVW